MHKLNEILLIMSIITDKQHTPAVNGLVQPLPERSDIIKTCSRILESNQSPTTAKKLNGHIVELQNARKNATSEAEIRWIDLAIRHVQTIGYTQKIRGFDSSIIDAELDPRWYYLEGDPLSSKQKRTIKAFVEKYLLTAKLNGPTFEALMKTYYTPDLETAKKKLGGPDFTAMRQAFLNPASVADELGLDPNSSEQIFAARMLMKAAIRVQMYRGGGNYGKMLKFYHDKMTTNLGYGVSETISVKNQMLMANDPVQKLDPLKQNHTALDLVLAHIHFKEPRGANGGGPTREEARAMYKDEITKLWQSPDTKHIIEGLAALIRKENVECFFSEFPGRLGELRLPFVRSNPAPEVQGLYSTKHSICIASLILPTSKIDTNQLGTFVHEAQHLLFNKIVQNRSSPVCSGSDEEKELDEALRKDGIHRCIRLDGISWGKNDPLTEAQASVHKVFVSGLEQQKCYFPRGFNASDPEHLHTMRVEAIVRIAELLAEGTSHDDIKELAPNLHAFYLKYSKPLIERFVLSNISQS